MSSIWTASNHDYSGSRSRQVAFVAYTALLALLCFLALSVPDRVFASSRLHDVVIFLDGIYRVGVGQVPHLDFASPLGAFAFCWPQVAGWLPGLDATLADGQALLTVLCVIAATWLALSRLTLVVGVVYVTLVALLVAAPMEPGGSTKAVSFAMYYNRICYAMVLLPLLLIAPSASRVRLLPYALLFAATGFVTLHLKITFFAAWLGIVVFVVLMQRALRPALYVALVLMATAMVAIEVWVPGFYEAYLRDLRLAGGVRLGDGKLPGEVADAVARNALLFGIIVWAARNIASRLYMEKVSRILFVSGVAMILLGATVVFILNVQQDFIVLPEALLLVLASMLMRVEHGEGQVSRLYILLILLAVLALGPELTGRVAALNKYYRGAEVVRITYPFQVPVEVSTRLAVREKGVSVFAAFGSDGVITVPEMRAVMTSMGSKQEIYQEDYLYSIVRGLDALRDVMRVHGSGTVMTVDYSNPFPALLHLPPVHGDYLWYHDGVNVGVGDLPPPEKFFPGVKYVLVPQVPARMRSRDFVLETYGPWIVDHYHRVDNGGIWEIWLRN